MTIKRDDLQAAAEAGVLQTGHLVVLQEACAFEAACWLDGGNRPQAAGRLCGKQTFKVEPRTEV